MRRLAPLASVFVLVSAVTPASAAPLFSEVANPFGTQLCSGGKQGCWTNYARMTDIDGDGDLDVLFPNADGYFNKGASAQPLAVYLNDGTGSFTNGSAAIAGGYVGYVRQIAVGDVDGDLDLDLYVPAAWGDPDVLLLNDAGTFVNHASTHLPAGLASNAGATRFGDADGDGDLDLFVGDSWAEAGANQAHLYANDGSGHFTAKFDFPSNGVTQPIDFDLLDADGDFDLDLLVDSHAATSALWINDGAGGFAIAPAFPAQSGLKYGPVTCDVDGDGDLDAWFDNSGPNYTEQLLINDGTGKFADETAARVSGNPGADDNLVACIDIDGDGDLDAAIASLSNVERILMNDGTGHFTAVADAFPPVSDGTLWLECGDVNGDGRLDCITAQGESSFLDRLYIGTAAQPVDTRAPAFRAVETVVSADEAAPVPIRFAVVDNVTTDEGPRLDSAWLSVDVAGDVSTVPATFIGGDLFRAVIPPQAAGVTVSYQACAKDRQGNQGCAAAKSFPVVYNPMSSSSASTSASTGSMTSSTATGQMPTSGASSGAGGGQGGGGGGGSEGGCSCDVGASDGAPWTAALGALALVIARTARRRSPRRSGSPAPRS